MSEVINKSKKKKIKNGSFNNLVGPTDKKIDERARDLLITARVGLLIRHSFFGNLATRLKLINADEWCATAATDGRNFYYNSRFVNMLKQKEVEFLFGHEVLHVVYDHFGRRDERDPQVWNIANDYAVNADLKRHKVGEFITSVPCLYEVKYDGKYSEHIYDDLMKDVNQISLDELIDQLLDEHMDVDDDKESEGKGRPKPLTAEEREELRQEIKQNIINAAKGTEPGQLPLGVKRLIEETISPQMPWPELIQTNLTSSIKTDYSFSRPNRRGWHMDVIMPGTIPGEEIDIVVALDMSGSISNKQCQSFLSEVSGMMEMFNGFKIHVFCFDTEIYNPQTFISDNLDTMGDYEPMGGGGTDFTSIFRYLKERGEDTKRLIVFTDGMPFGSWGTEDFTDTTWIIHGSKDIVPPWGTWAYFD